MICRWLTFVLYSTLAVAQQPLRPYVFGGMGLNGAGYAPVSAIGGAGVMINTPHWFVDGNGLYNTMGKNNDNTNSINGYQYHIGTDVFYRYHAQRWYAGAGVSWSETSTSNYSKTAWHPRAGGGADFNLGSLYLRGQAVYVMPGSDWKNGVQGPEITLWIPGPIDHHLMWRQTVGIYNFHTTITDPSDPALTAAEKAHRAWTCFVQMTVMYRF